MIQEKDKRLTLIISIAVAFILIVLIVIGMYIKSLSDSTGSDEVKINNYDTYVKNLPSSERTAIQKTLYTTTTYNVTDVQKIKGIKDASIRDSTYRQDIANSIYTTTFIVDIASIKQSYEIKDMYSNQDVSQTGLTDYTTLALCLPKDKLKYGEFICQDRLSKEAGMSRSDPILQYLPVSTLDYTLSLDLNSKDIHLIDKINLTEVDYNTGVDAAVAQYKAKLKDWFTSKDLNIDDYSITYQY